MLRAREPGQFNGLRSGEEQTLYEDYGLSDTQQIPGRPAAALTGELRKHSAFPSRYLRRERDVTVYLPAGYEEQTQQRFPVLYLQDGQNLFDGATSFIRGKYWRVAETVNELVAASEIQPLIIVGIDHADEKRIQEYTPVASKKLGGGKADRYGLFLLEELKPFIESKYRMLAGPENTGLGGSSLGGLVTLYLGLRLPQVFGKLAVFSPSVWWSGRWIHQFAAKTNISPRPRIWLDIGKKEGARILGDVREFRDILVNKGWLAGSNLHFEEVPGGTHDEDSWARCVGPCLRYLFPSAEAKV